MTQARQDQTAHSIFKKFAYLLSAQWLRDVLHTVFLVQLARHSMQTYGQFMLAINMGDILLFVAEFGLNQHLATLLARKADYPSTILKQVTVVKASLLGVAWLGMIGYILLQEYSSSLALLVIVIATGVGLEAIASSYYVACQILGRQDIESKWRAAASLTGYGYAIASILLGAPGIVIAFWKLLETMLAGLGAITNTLRRARAKFRMRQVKVIWNTWRGSLVYTIMAIASIFYNKINIFFLQKYGGSEAIAQYSATWQIIDGVCILISGTLLRRVLFPLFVKLWVTNKGEFQRLSQNTARWLMATAIPVSFVLFVEADRIITLIYGPQYADAIWMQRYLVGAILAAFLHNLAHYLMISIQCERLLLIFYLLGLAVNLLLCMFLIPPYPLLGTALAIVCTKGLVALLTVSFCQLRLRIFPWRTVFHLLLATLAGAGCYLLASEHLFREAAELLAILPIAWLAWHWRTALNAHTVKVI